MRENGRPGALCIAALLACLMKTGVAQAQAKPLAIPLNDHQRLGQRFTAASPFSSLWIHAPSWSDNEGGFTLTLWDSPRRQRKIASEVFRDYVDNAWLELKVVPPAPPGTYYWEITAPTGRTRVGLWASQPNEASEDCAYLDDKPSPNLRFHQRTELSLAHMRKDWPRPEQLIAALKSDASLQEKADTCRRLAVVGGKEAVPVLAELLSDERLAHMARYALERIPDPSVDEALRAALGRLKGKLLIGVINSLGVRRDEKAVKPLSQGLKDPDPQVAAAAADALGKVGTPEAAKVLEGCTAFHEARLSCADALAAKGHRDQAAAIYDALRAAQSASSVPHAVRAAALRGAILVRQSDGLPLLVEQLRSGDIAMFGVALWLAQRDLPGAEVTRALAAELDKLPADRQALLSEALGRRGDGAALPALCAATRSAEKSVRLAAFRALAAMTDPSAIPVFIEGLADPDTNVARAAQDGLGKFPGNQADAAIMSLMESAEPSRRLAAIELAGQRGMRTAVPSLLKATHDSDERIRLASFKALEDVGGPEEVPPLLEMLPLCPSAKEMEAAARALSAACGKAADREACAEKIVAALAPASPAVKQVLLRVLRSVGGGVALKAVREAINDPDAQVKATAVRLLGEWRTMDAADDLLRLAKSSADPTMKILSLRSYIRLAANKDAPDDRRLALCREASALITRDEERKLLLGTLASLPTVESLALATPHLNQAPVKEEACAAVVAIAEGLTRGRAVPPSNAPLFNALKKVAQTTANPALAQRARALMREE